MLQSITNWVRNKKEDFKAWRRGEERIAPYGTRGRVFAKRKGTGLAARGRGKVKVEMLIKRADGTLERRSVPGKFTFFKH